MVLRERVQAMFVGTPGFGLIRIGYVLHCYYKKRAVQKQ